MSNSVWGYRKNRYAKIATTLVAVALVAFVVHGPASGRNGGTWVGYAIGTMAAGLTGWLAWYGIRKRRYGKHPLPLAEILSAHVNFGIAAFLLATLHAGFEFGLNFHFISYGLLLAISISGFCGVLLYAYVPTAMTDNAKGRSTTDMIEEIAEINRDARRTGAELDDDINRLTRRSVQYTQIGGGVWRLLSGHYKERHTEEALEGVREQAEHFTAAEAEAGRRLVTLLARKLEAVDRLRRHIRYEAWMDIWLYLHIPMTFAYLIALVGHILFVFYY